METRAPYVAVGVFVVLLIAGLVVAILWFAQVQFREQLAYYDIYFEGSVTGLTTGSTVRDNGIPVGRVAEIQLDPSDPSRVRVTIELRGGIAVKEDTVAALEMQGLAGGIYLDLTGGTRDSPNLERRPDERYPVITSRRSGLEQVVNAAPELLERLLALSDQVSKVLSPDNVEAISETLGNFRALSQTLAGRSSELGGAIDNAAQSMQGLHDTLNSVNDILAGLKQLVQPQGGLQETLKSIDETSHRFGELAQHLDAVVTANGPQIGAQTQQTLAEITRVAQQTEALEQQLSHIAETIERDPSRFLYGDRRQGYRPQ